MLENDQPISMNTPNPVTAAIAALRYPDFFIEFSWKTPSTLAYLRKKALYGGISNPPSKTTSFPVIKSIADAQPASNLAK